MTGHVRILLCALILACCFAPRMGAQATSSSIFGAVTDTNGMGQYVLPLLPLGTYQVEVSASGFKKFVRTGIVLDLSRNARIDPVLELGDVSTTVTVTSDAPVVNTSDPRLDAQSRTPRYSLDFRWPYTYQMNFSVQREVMRGLSVTAAYVGSLGHKLPFQRDLNYPLPAPGATTGNVNRRRPFLTGTLSNIYLVEPIVNTAYHGLQLTAERRMSRRFTFKGYYTFSKALDDIDMQQSNVQVNAQNHRRLDLERARTATDRRQNLVASTVWDADYFRTAALPVRVLLDHWTLFAPKS